MNDFYKQIEQYIGPDNLQKLQQYHIGIAGAGGLGSNCAFNLVRTGVSNLTIVDYDNVESSNLNRQFYFADQVGMPKVQALETNLKRINPDLNLVAHQTKIDTKNIKDLFDDCDIIVEAFDVPSCKTMLVEAFLSSDKLVVCASGLAGFGQSDDIKIQRVRKNLIIVGDQTTGIDQAPPLSPRVNIAAAKQADVIVEYILQKS